MKESMFVTPEYITAKEIKALRKQLGLTQKEFSILVNCSKSTIERWEMSSEPITGTIVLLVKMLERYPTYVKDIKLPPKTMPIRLWYMHDQMVCTIIDVNEMKKEIQIVNYTDNIMFKAFGVEEHPDYDMYLSFLESRCFPASRDKMKLILKEKETPNN